MSITSQEERFLNSDNNTINITSNASTNTSNHISLNIDLIHLLFYFIFCIRIISYAHTFCTYLDKEMYKTKVTYFTFILKKQLLFVYIPR